MPTDFLQLAGKTVLVTGVANRKSVAWHIARLLVEADCRVIYSVRSPERREQVAKLVDKSFGQGSDDILVCDVEHEEQIKQLAAEVSQRRPPGRSGALDCIRGLRRRDAAFPRDIEAGVSADVRYFLLLANITFASSA